MDELEGFQRRHLRGLAHPLAPVVMIGKEGLTEAVLAKTDRELVAHELIKVRFGDWKEEKRELLAQMAEKLLAEVVGVVGHVGILFRQNREPKLRKIRVPARPRSRVAKPGGSGR
ncbi:MAG: ribosome assembly RNA-binding protein YhbY [Myxococcota bacterium]